MKTFLFVLLLVSSSTLLATEALQVPRTQVIELAEPNTKRIYPIFVKTPASYDKKKQKQYPVIYLTDAWYSFQIASGATRFPMNSGKMAEAILVGISYEKGSKGPSSRIRDYTPSTDKSWRFETGNASGHSQFIRDTLIPFINRHYRTNDQRTFVGNSLGGLLGAYLLFNQPETFTSYIIGSPSVWFNDNEILNSSHQPISKRINVYLAVGDMERPEFGQQHDMVAGAQQLKQKINAVYGKNVNLTFKVIDDARHATAFPTTLIQGLDWLYGK
ncbi:alpha/beta hydrolase [Thalassotalea ganghwensis]